ncbi:MAG: RNA polymerase sigma factor [Planctomycetes bacterium]|nr:RNA polymerase sigma factor [Planctomycetota bacterium]
MTQPTEDLASLDDAELMRQVKEGRLDRFDELVRRYRMPLTRVAASKLGDDARAEDIVQETFLAIYAARETYNPRFAFRTWLWTILLNLCRRAWRRTNRSPREFLHAGFDSQGDSGPPEPFTGETGLSRVLQIERKEQLAALLNTLPETQADAVRLRFFGELKYAEIARTMGSSLIGAKVRVRKGLLTLALRLKDAEGETR